MHLLAIEQVEDHKGFSKNSKGKYFQLIPNYQRIEGDNNLGQQWTLA